MIAKYSKSLLGGFLVVSMAFLGYACTDDSHFDVISDDAVASKSIWENIESQPNLTELKQILEKAPVVKTETDNKSVLTYKDFLSGTQSFTFWAPIDGSYDATKYLNLLAQAELETDPIVAARLKYEVSHQFVQNHLARFNYESFTGDQSVVLMNSKITNYNSSKKQFGNLTLVDGYENIPSSNGSLHIVNGVYPFMHNMREFLFSGYDSLTTVLRSYEEIDSTDLSKSIEGAVNDDGYMVYLDTIYNTTNKMLNLSRAKISDEDSLYVGILPATDAAWDQMNSKIKKLYKYGAYYFNDWDYENLDFKNNKTTTAKSFNTDSVTLYNAHRDIMRSMFVSASSCGFDTKVDSAEFIDYVMTADSLVTTAGVVIYNPNKGGVNPLFQGLTPVRGSNGYVFELQNFNADPCDIWAEKINLDLAGNEYYVIKTEFCKSDRGELVRLDSENRNDTIYGDVENNRFRRFDTKDHTKSTTLRICIKLDKVKSTAYRLKMVMAPAYINKYNLVDESEAEVVSGFTAEVYYDHTTKQSPKKVTTSKANVIVDQDSVKEYVVFDKLVFDRCYDELPDNADSFPYLQIEVDKNHQNGKSGGVTYKNNYALNIVKIILEPLREDEQ